jgi:transposase
MNIQKIYKFIFLNLANNRDLEITKIKSNRGRKPLIIDNEIFYNEFIDLLKEGKQWRDLKNFASYTVYFKKFKEWSINNLFKEAYFILILYLFQHRYITNKQINNSYIDSTMIRNKQGIECIGKNYSDKFKNGTKSSVISTENGIPLSLFCIKSNIHDVNTVEDTINNSILNLNNKKIGGDKGYISKNLKNKLKINKNIDFITDDKINNKIKNSKKNNIFLKKRYIIENLFSWLKNKKRIQLRYDKSIQNYEQFTYLSFGLIVENKFKNNLFNITKRMIKIYENKIINSNLINSFLL